MSELTKEQQELLKRLTDEMMNLATSVVSDYETTPSDLTSGSIVQIHEGSPYVASKEERLKTMKGLNENMKEKGEE